jgi:hypothetical protein
VRNTGQLRPYQQRLITRLYESDAVILWARMGAGKTVVGLTAIAELINDGVIRHALIVAPKRVARHVWPAELAEWTHLDLRIQVLDGNAGQRLDMLARAERYDISIIGIDVLPWLLEALRRYYPDNHPLFDLLVLDEISRLRNPTGVGARAMAKARKRWRMVWGMTGTLRPSSALDLFMPARIVTDGALWGPSFYKWRNRHFYPVDYNGYTWAALPGAEDVLHTEIAPLVAGLEPDEMPQLPSLCVIQDRFTLPPSARKHYDSMHRRLVAVNLNPDGDSVIAVNAAVATGKLAQIANGFLYDDDDDTVHRVHREKLDWLADLIDTATAPTLLVYEFVEDRDAMRALVFKRTGASLPELADGDDVIDRWNAGQLRFMALHPASGGHGLNLQHGGSTMLWMAPTWSGELWGQTLARLHRPGQREPVVVRVCIADRTVDDMKFNRSHYRLSAQAACEAYLAAFASTTDCLMPAS